MHRQTPLERLDQEIQDHLDIETRHNLDRGMDPVTATPAGHKVRSSLVAA
jgi:hypothetical protein